MEQDVIFKRGTKAEIDAEPISDGKILFTTDQIYNKIYTDNGTKRIQIGGTMDVDTTLSTTSSNPIANSTATAEFNKINTYFTTMWEKVYPVGCIYQSTDSTSPATLFGGVWNQLKDRFLVSAGGEYASGSVGGYEDATLVSHSHSVSVTGGNHKHSIHINAIPATAQAGGYTAFTASGTDVGNAIITNESGSLSMSGETSTDGSSGTGKNIPPYYAVYTWIRSA